MREATVSSGHTGIVRRIRRWRVVHLTHAACISSWSVDGSPATHRARAFPLTAMTQKAQFAYGSSKHAGPSVDCSWLPTAPPAKTSTLLEYECIRPIRLGPCGPCMVTYIATLLGLAQNNIISFPNMVSAA
jgi:hypothetical protein